MVKAHIWWQNVKYNLKNEKGQGMVEYGLIITVVSLAALVGMGLLGSDLNTFFTNLAGKITVPAS